MRLFIFWVASFLGLVFAQDARVLELTGVQTTHTFIDGSIKDVFIERIIPSSCINVGIEVKTIFGGDYAGSDVPKVCQKSVVTVVGKAQPMVIAQGVVTVGEVEVLDFIKNKQGKYPQEYILVDSRKRDWFEQMSIPSSVNIPYDEVAYDALFPEDFQKLQMLLGFKQTQEGYDFSHAKTALFFCNGSWCAQSRLAIEALIAMGYPKEKLLWYRGGMQDWLLFGFSVVKP